MIREPRDFFWLCPCLTDVALSCAGVQGLVSELSVRRLSLPVGIIIYVINLNNVFYGAVDNFFR